MKLYACKKDASIFDLVIQISTKLTIYFSTLYFLFHEHILIVLFVIITGMYTADILSGIFHYLCDTYELTDEIKHTIKQAINEHKSTNNQDYILSKIFKKVHINGWEENAINFQFHHIHPIEITKVSNFQLFLYYQTATCRWLIFTVCLFLYILAGKEFKYNFISIAISYILIISFICLHFAHIFHKYTHIPKYSRPILIRILQKFRIALSPKSHFEHHKDPFDKNFSVFNGWANSFVYFIVKIITISKYKLFSKM